MQNSLRLIVLLIWVCFATSAFGVKTHVHVEQVDSTNLQGFGRANVQVFYGTSAGEREPFGLTDKDGVAEGDIDIDTLGRQLSLFLIRPGDQRLIEKRVELTDDVLAKGLVVTLIPAGESLTSAFASTEAGRPTPCEMYCAPTYTECGTVCSECWSGGCCSDGPCCGTCPGETCGIPFGSSCPGIWCNGCYYEQSYWLNCPNY